jgi:hypothetical protein
MFPTENGEASASRLLSIVGLTGRRSTVVKQSIHFIASSSSVENDLRRLHASSTRNIVNVYSHFSDGKMTKPPVAAY